jgi:hypothetical protein
MADWENYKGIEIPEATPPGAAGLRLKDNFIYVADQLETLSTNRLSIVSKTSSYTAVPGELIVCDVSAGSFAISLPSITANAHIGVKLGTASGSNIVTIVPGGADEIDGRSNIVLYVENDCVEIQGDVSNGQWLIVNDVARQSSEVYAYTGNGHGTTNTKIRRYEVDPVLWTRNRVV